MLNKDRLELLQGQFIGDGLISQKAKLSINRDEMASIFCVCIAYKTNIRADIDKVFNKDKIAYIESYKNSSFYNNSIFQGEPIDTVIYAEKMAGLLEYADNTDNFDDIYDISKKAFRRIYNNIKNLDEVGFDDVLKYVTNNFLGMMDAVSLTFIYLKLNSNFFFDEDSLSIFTGFLDDVTNIMTGRKQVFSKDILSDKKEFINEKRKYFGIPKGRITINSLFSKIIHHEVTRYNKNQKLFLDDLDNNFDNIYNNRNITERGEISKYIGALEGLIMYLNINSFTVFSTIEITSKEIDELLVALYYATDCNNLDEQDSRFYFIASLYMYALDKEYKKSKEKYLKDFSEDFVIENEKLQNRLKESISNANKIQHTYNEKSKEIEEKNKALLKEVEQLKKENKRLLQKVEDNENAKIENIKLRNYVFDNTDVNLETDNEEENEEDLNLDILNNKNVVILGGSVPWMNKMKEKLPNATIANVESKHYELDFIHKDSIVFINTKMNHGFYYKIKNKINNLGLDYNYVHNYTNTYKSLKDMINKMPKD